MNPVEEVVKAQAAMAGAAGQLQKLRKACDGFEAQFVKSMLKSMQKDTFGPSSGQGLGKGIYQSMFNDAVSNDLAQTESLGIGPMIFRPMADVVMAKEMAAQTSAAMETTKGKTK